MMTLNKLNECNGEEYLGDEATPEMVGYVVDFLRENGVDGDTEINEIPESLWLDAISHAAKECGIG